VTPPVLVVNAGSSTLKLSVLDDRDDPVAATVLDGDDARDQDRLAAFVQGAGEVGAVGHRFVHGGADHTAPTHVTAEVADRLRALVPLAPLHQPAALDALDAVTDLLPAVPAVACFDTAFHATIPDAARTYAVPGAWRERWPVRRFGFHGLSHAGAARQAERLVGGPVARLVSCHLGAGSSLCAVRDGRSVDTTMGFTPLEGLVMASRSGTVDPGLVLWLIEEAGLSPAEVRAGLEGGGGLTALAGDRGDLRTVLADADAGVDTARQAYAVWLHRARRELGAMIGVLGGVDAVVFTGGIGQHQPRVRADLVGGLAWLGAHLDPAANSDPDGEAGDGRDLTGPGSTVRVLMVPAREDAEIARQVRAVVTERSPASR
jgi:acetate kinase